MTKQTKQTQQYDNSGILFRNEDKDPDNERDRDYSGSITVAGVEYWLSAWIKQGKRSKFLSLSVKPKEVRKPGAGAAAAAKSPHRPLPIKDELEDEIPF